MCDGGEGDGVMRFLKFMVMRMSAAGALRKWGVVVDVSYA